MSVRMNFEHELETLRENMDAMGKGIQQAFADLLSAIALNDLEELDRIQKNDRKINEMERKIEAECLLLLTRQQPVLASDLRIVSSVMKAVGDMERIGDHAADIADMAVRLNGISYKEYAPSMPEMLEETRKILCDGVELFMARDKEQAKEFYKRDDKIDDLFNQVKEELVACLKEKGLRIALIKHDAHGFEIDQPGKDSYRLRKAGVDTMILSGPEQTVQIQTHATGEPSLKQLLSEIHDVDLILIEGDKFGSQPKIQLLRKDYNETPVGNLENTIAYVANFPYAPAPGNLPVFDLNEPTEMAEYLISRFI